ncbi:hypothetical protein JW935_15125 [candidate division KSB1 bacterium]|nr:hypothetical protein [candidate division KSB1 bacterium]
MSGTVQARSIGMGGTMTSVQDAVGSSLYNPAAMGFYQSTQRSRFTMFLDPLGAAFAVDNQSELSAEDKFDGVDWLSLTGLLVKACAFSSQHFSVSLVLSEHLGANPYMEKKFVSNKGILDWNYNVLSTRIVLANQVSIGASGFLFSSMGNHDVRRLFGSSYGVFLQPGPTVSVGIAYFDLPNNVDSIFLQRYRIIDETINVGIQFQPASYFILSADLRNVSEEDREYTREVHLGSEVIPWSWIAFRGGYYKNLSDNTRLLSLGFGLLNNNFLRSSESQFVFSDYTLNYALQMDYQNNVLNYVHYLSFLFRL